MRMVLLYERCCHTLLPLPVCAWQGGGLLFSTCSLSVSMKPIGVVPSAFCYECAIDLWLIDKITKPFGGDKISLTLIKVALIADVKNKQDVCFVIK